MVAKSRQSLTLSRHFLEPTNATHRRYEALRAYFVEGLLRRAGLPGTEMVPAGCAVRALLALKLYGNARHSHVLDEGLALFAGLNVIPKRSFLTEYSGRIEPGCYPRLMRGWFDALGPLGMEWGTTFDLDFHTIPFHGEDALLEKHYVSKRSRRQKGGLAFLAQEGDRRVFCYANADLRKEQQNDEILQFVSFWKKRTGRLPKELIFDSRLTTHAKLDRLNRLSIDFFHMDALSSSVALKVNCDLQLTLMASSLYRLLGARFDEPHISIPWFGRKRLQLVFG